MVNYHGDDFTAAHFSGNCNFTAATFDDVNMHGAFYTNADKTGTTFADVNFRGSTFTDVNLSNVSIVGSTITGMKIDGIPVEDAIAAYKKQTPPGTNVDQKV